MTEIAFLADLKSRILATNGASQALPIPPGDDCALVPATQRGVLFAADMLMEGVHFDLAMTSPELVGRKALAVNLSDIAAMAGKPTGCVVSLGLPKARGLILGDGVMRGIIDLANQFGVAVAGGDTNSWNGPLVVNVAVIGDPHPKGSVRRSGARPGDMIMVTGQLGGSIHGRHLTFLPRVMEATVLHTRYSLSAMIDMSDGLATDLRHILEESQVGARLQRDAIPLHPDCRRQGAGLTALLNHAIQDGEDFELLFTVPAHVGKMILKDAPFDPDLHISCIGTITAPELGLVWEDGSPVEGTGFAHKFD